VTRAPLIPIALAAVASIWIRPAAQERAIRQAVDQGRTGRTIYVEHCAECHGTSGKGDGPAAHMLMPRPRDFTAGRYKIRSTESGSIPTDADLLQSVRQGLHGTAMPGWASLLSESEIRRVVDYLKSLSPRFGAETPQPIIERVPIAGSTDSVTRGARMYERLQCGKCHGTDGRGAGAVATEFEDDWRQPLKAANLSEPWTFRGGSSARDMFLRFRGGMSGTPMPSFREAASDNDLWDLANYVTSLARKPLWNMDAVEVEAFFRAQDAAARANPVERGRYLVDTMGCALCHSPLDDQKRLIPGMKFAGGLMLRIEPFGEYPTGNITSDRETGIGSWTDDEIKRVITRGTLRDGTRLLPYPMDWTSFSTLSPDDLDALVAYLRTIPPITNRVPRPTRTFLPKYLWGKFQMIFLASDPPMTFYGGNVGVRPGAH
jgi:cytochrome c oxidase cbb3-type subunit 2